MYTGRTKKYVDAMIAEGNKFDYRAWYNRVRHEEAQLKSTCEPSRVQLAEPDRVAEIGAQQISATTTSRKNVLRSSIPAGKRHSNEKRKTDLRQRLDGLRDAWADFQRNRRRDAIYPFLDRVYRLVARYERRGRLKRLFRQVQKLTGIKADADTNIYSILIRSAAGPDDIDPKASSRWARALRYVAHFKKPRAGLRPFIKNRGGINGCAALYAEHFGRGRR